MPHDPSFMNLETTLITGASSGIGPHLTHEFTAFGKKAVSVAPGQSAVTEEVPREQRKHERGDLEREAALHH